LLRRVALVDEEEIFDGNWEEGNQRRGSFEEMAAVGFHISRWVHQLQEILVFGNEL